MPGTRSINSAAAPGSEAHDVRHRDRGVLERAVHHRFLGR